MPNADQPVHPGKPPVWTDDDIEELAGWNIIRAYLAFVPEMSRALAPVGISPAQFGILVQVDNSPGIAQGALARRCLVSPQSMGEALPPLEALGLIARGERPGRGHPIPVYITEAGRKLVKKSTKAVLAVNTPEAMGLDADEQRTLRRLLQKVVGTLVP
ncbi:MarR family winged helix-turn-helix transcriptional regulator [Amycolatopsis sp. QT-25]|uniref:MarR family winged helix-turn-helix transcriptional regulator n=1 Tax=Amycolatopsis sp. QT-25 TaxID=3034022 RepID=UPI0023ED75EC|nr:MarR family winged helix-turn-helix transcriptional regulator [Amycolatopsis sp. QT-25]WET76819.1 MarR family winged helix-turn-helix transcriptional regulator [Amycolatopsis sp. QT-25]